MCIGVYYVHVCICLWCGYVCAFVRMCTHNVVVFCVCVHVYTCMHVFSV